MNGVGCRVWGVGCRAWCAGCRNEGLGVEIRLV